MKIPSLTLVLCAASLSALAAGIDGKWVSEMQVGDADGKTYTHTTTYTLKNDNGSLTGTIVQTSAAPCSCGIPREYQFRGGRRDPESAGCAYGRQ